MKVPASESAAGIGAAPGPSAPPTMPADAAAAGVRPRRGWTRVVPDPLRVPAFRRFWLGLWPLLLGKWMQLVALGYLTFSLTHSVPAVGLVGAADGLPALVLGLPAGVLADRASRRHVLMATTTAMAATAFGLTAAVVTGHAGLLVLVLAAAAFGSADAVDVPSRQALVADLVREEQLLGTAALTSTASSATRIVGPSLAGILIGFVGPAACFGAMGALALPFLAVVVLGLRGVPRTTRPADGHTALQDLGEGLRWAARDPRTRWILIAMGALAILGVGYMPYLPVLARDQLHGGGQLLGLLYTMGGIGALAGGIAITGLSRRLPRGRLLIGAAPLYTAALVTVTRATTAQVAFPALMGVSLAFVALNTASLSALQSETPARLRGRVLACYSLIWGVTPFGTLLYALLSRVVPLFDAIAGGAVAAGLVLLVAGTRPAVRSLR
ncbi:MAG TPA: MFS transporter [Candidatus Micrarchaeia archaeon]|nr:MFS transporter [Candidatus Micrarchaeia archaeon]